MNVEETCERSITRAVIHGTWCQVNKKLLTSDGQQCDGVTYEPNKTGNGKRVEQNGTPSRSQDSIT